MRNILCVDCCGCEGFIISNETPFCLKKSDNVDYFTFCKDYEQDEFYKELVYIEE